MSSIAFVIRALRLNSRMLLDTEWKTAASCLLMITLTGIMVLIFGETWLLLKTTLCISGKCTFLIWARLFKTNDVVS